LEIQARVTCKVMLALFWSLSSSKFLVMCCYWQEPSFKRPRPSTAPHMERCDAGRHWCKVEYNYSCATLDPIDGFSLQAPPMRP
jgi:hypothetical protein